MTRNIIIVFILVSLFLFWEIQERRLPVDRSHSGHNTSARFWIRLLMPGLGIILILQLLGILKILPFSVPAQLVNIAYVVFLLAVGLAFWARTTMGSNWTHGADYQIKPGQKLVTSGPFRYIRHPIYVSFVLIFFSLELALGSWLFLLTIPLILFISQQAQAEEQLLLKAFGPEYEKYRASTWL